MAFKEMYLINPKGLSLYTVQYLPVDRPATANLIWAHGYGEHVGRYHKSFKQIAAAGIAVHSFDAAAHGKSEPKDKKSRAVVWRFKDLVDDMYFVSGQLLKESNTEHLPTFLGGQSMGGLIQAYAALRDQPRWAGLILHSAAIDVEWTPVMRAQAPVGGLLGRIIPRARIVPAVRPGDMSQDPKVVEDYLSDPLNTTGKVPARTGAQLLNAFRGLKSKYKLFTLPIYVAHGTSDRCTSLSGVKNMLKHVSSKDIELNEVQGGYHEMIHGPEMDACCQSIVTWISSRQLPRSKI